MTRSVALRTGACIGALIAGATWKSRVTVAGDQAFSTRRGGSASRATLCTRSPDADNGKWLK
jgi:hypothetical protein